MVFFIFLLSFFLQAPLFLWAKTNSSFVDESSVSLDWSLSLGARSLPFGAALSSELGLNSLIWGDRESNWQFGTIQTAVYGSTSGFVNTVGTKLVINPISFVELSLGAERARRLERELSFVDCQSVRCFGLLDTRYVRALVFFAFGPWQGALSHSEVVLRSGQLGAPIWSDLDALVSHSGSTIGRSSLTIGQRVLTDSQAFLGFQWQLSGVRSFRSSWTRYLGVFRWQSPARPIEFSMAFGLATHSEKGGRDPFFALGVTHQMQLE